MSAPAVAPGVRRRAAPPPPGASRKISSDGTGAGGSTANPTSYDALKLKYMTVDRNYETLKELTRKGTWFPYCTLLQIVLRRVELNLG